MQLELKQTTQNWGTYDGAPLDGPVWQSSTFWPKLLIILRKNPKLHPRGTKLAFDIPPTPRPHRGRRAGPEFRARRRFGLAIGY